MPLLKRSALALCCAISVFAADYAAEGKLWWRHIQFLASDRLAGRDIGTEGFRTAVEYVTTEFERLGLKPAGASGYLQPVAFESRQIVEEQSSLALVRGERVEPLTLGTDATLSARADLAPAVEAPMVFVGYGMVVPEARYDDLAGLDLKGKIAVYVGAPGPVEAPGPVKSHYSSSVERWNALRAAGAIGFATIPGARPSMPANTPAPAGARRRPPQPAVVLADTALQETPGQLIALTITARGAEKLFADSGHTLQEIQDLAKANKPLPRFELPGLLRARTAMKHERLESVNIAGMLPGSDPKLKSEYVILSAHLDHLGTGRPVNGDDLYNGAMDDASGIATILEVARLMKEGGVKPKRSILFLAVSAEEKGELGSRYFAAHPTVPSDKIVADVNLDMFLPIYPLKFLEVQGLGESTLGDAIRAAAKELGVEVQFDNEPEQNRFIRSDQYSFIREGVPAPAFKFGYQAGSAEEKLRKDWIRDRYHKPSDDLEQPVDLAAAGLFDRVILKLMERVADDAERPQWYRESFFRRFAERGK